MPKDEILLKFEGGDASRHTIDARLYGQSLLGLDRMVSDCLIVTSQIRLPRRRERAPLLLKAREGYQGSYAVPQILQEAATLLGVGVPILTAIGPEIVGYYVQAVLDRFSGKRASMEAAIDRMANMHNAALKTAERMHRDTIEALSEFDKRRHEESIKMHDLLRLSIESNGAAAANYVAPIGPSVGTSVFQAGNLRPVVTSMADAEAIRDSQRVDWQHPRNETFVTDGFKYHSHGLSIENPDGDGFLMADIKDPIFIEQDSNPYTQAAQRRAKIEVLARRGYKNGALAKVHILDFIREVGDEAA